MPIITKSRLTTLQAPAKIMNDIGALFPFFSAKKIQGLLERLGQLNKVLSHTLTALLLVGFILDAIVEFTRLIFARNKNLDRWLAATTAMITAITGGSALIGILAYGLSVTVFAISGPWLLLIALAVANTHQLYASTTNLFRGFMANKGSQERTDYFQKSWAHLFKSLTLGLGIVLLVASLLSPLGPLVVFTLMAATTLLAAAGAIWFAIACFKPQWTESLKTFMGLSNSLDNELLIPTSTFTSINPRAITTPVNNTLFKRAYHKDVVRRCLQAGQLQEAREYLINAISTKTLVLQSKSRLYVSSLKRSGSFVETPKKSGAMWIRNISDVPSQNKTFVSPRKPPSDKNHQKFYKLYELSQFLQQTTLPDKTTIDTIKNQSGYSKVFQSSFADIGDTEDLFAAAELLYETTRVNSLTVSPLTERRDSFPVRSIT